MIWLVPQLFSNHLYGNDLIYRGGHLYLPVSTAVSIIVLLLALIGATGALAMNRYMML